MCMLDIACGTAELQLVWSTFGGSRVNLCSAHGHMQINSVVVAPFHVRIRKRTPPYCSMQFGKIESDCKFSRNESI